MIKDREPKPDLVNAPTIKEVELAIVRLKRRKAPGPTGLTPDSIKNLVQHTPDLETIEERL